MSTNQYSASLFLADGWQLVTPSVSRASFVGLAIGRGLVVSATDLSGLHVLHIGAPQTKALTYDPVSERIYAAVATRGEDSALVALSVDGNVCQRLAELPQSYSVMWLLRTHAGEQLIANIVSSDAQQQAIATLDLRSGALAICSLGPLQRYPHLYSERRRAILYGRLDDSTLSFIDLAGHLVPSAIDNMPNWVSHRVPAGAGLHQSRDLLALGGLHERTIVDLQAATQWSMAGTALNPTFLPGSDTIWFYADQATLACLDFGAEGFRVVARLMGDGCHVPEDAHGSGLMSWSPDGAFLTARLVVKNAAIEMGPDALAGSNNIVKRVVVDIVQRRVWLLDELFDVVTLVNAQ